MHPKISQEHGYGHRLVWVEYGSLLELSDHVDERGQGLFTKDKATAQVFQELVCDEVVHLGRRGTATVGHAFWALVFFSRGGMVLFVTVDAFHAKAVTARYACDWLVEQFHACQASECTFRSLLGRHQLCKCIT